MITFCLILILLSPRPGDAGDDVLLKKIETYLNASGVVEKAKYMSPDYRFYFAKKEGRGEGKDSSLQSFQRWDAPLHPDIKILSYSRNQRTWTLRINEENDFTKLIKFPGCKATEIVTFDD